MSIGISVVLVFFSLISDVQNCSRPSNYSKSVDPVRFEQEQNWDCKTLLAVPSTYSRIGLTFGQHYSKY